MGFVQIIEMRTDRFDEVEALHEAWLAETEGIRTSTTETVARDRERPDHYFVIVEFPSYEVARTNNDLPATQRFAKEVEALLDGPPTFYDLDVVRFDRT